MKTPDWSIRALLKLGAAELERHGVPNARRNAEWILCHALECTTLYLYVNSAETPETDRIAIYFEWIDRRTQREPLQQIVEETEFMSLRLEMADGVFIPRPETETLVETALSFLESRSIFEPIAALDLCCGSGAVGVSMAHLLSNLSVYAVDIDIDAVMLTRRNARLAGVSERVEAAQADAISLLEHGFGENWPAFTVVACNPPYIATRDLGKLPPEVRDWDPPEALDGGVDGQDFYRRAIPLLSRRLARGGAVVFEIGDDQGEAVSQMLCNAGFGAVDVLPDYAGRDRVVIGVDLDGDSDTRH
jgi:release factor-specific protein-(glutamine-N5) methyltransferase